MTVEIISALKKLEETGIRTLAPLRRFGQGASYMYSSSPRRLVSQSAMLQERSVKGCRRTTHKTHRPLDVHWVILSTSKPFTELQYFPSR